MNSNLKREIIIENNSHPFHKETKGEEYIKINTRNESCIDNINLFLKIENNLIVDLYFDGEACAISTSVTSIMIKTLIGKTLDEALVISEEFEKMINEQEYNKNILGELNVYDEIYKQPNRKNCATLPFKGLKQIIKKSD